MAASGKTKSMLARIAVYVIGTLLPAPGVVLNTKSNLGISTTNSVPNALNVEVRQHDSDTWMTLGWACNIIHVVDARFQCMVYRQVRVKVLLQLPFSVLFGRVADLYVGLFVSAGVLGASTKALVAPSTVTQVVFLVLGIGAVLAFFAIGNIISFVGAGSAAAGVCEAAPAAPALAPLSNSSSLAPFIEAASVFSGGSLSALQRTQMQSRRRIMR